MQVDAEQAMGVLTIALGSVLSARAVAAPRLVGIHTGGVWIAERLHKSYGSDAPLGALDISFHRDDYGEVGLNPVVRPSRIPWDINGADIVLVDDVLYTGRTIRAALNELFDWGRPRSILLAVLVVRDGRELPIAPDAVGASVEVGAEHQLKLRGPDPFRLELVDTAR
jgi:pyrimidine operon attenuation protein/uracil phosphoribosyltransferase